MVDFSHTTTTKEHDMIRNSHLACTHAATKVGRAQCRKARAAAIAAGVAADIAATAPAAAPLNVPAPELQAEFDALTANQRAQAFVILDRLGADTREGNLPLFMRRSVDLANAARATKTTVAKLPKARINAVMI
ncbi:hypothetical protein SEA_YAKULT_35 [Gordonia phage Yakult]|nr:hypothetical protein SEA_YAKULT_35 [Gordonia phage Yakult]